MNFFKKIVAALFLIFSFVSSAQTTETLLLKTHTVNLPFELSRKIPLDEPTIGLALSGGGARGLTQIGVIKALEESGIQTNVIAGTSIGSIIGGCYASGYSVEEMDSIVVHTDWDQLLSISNTMERRELFVDQKIAEDWSLLTLRLDGLTPIIPTSFNEGLRLSNYLTLLCLNAPVTTEESFDSLWIKYRAVCTNLVDGNLVVLSNGSLARAMRASSSVSFLLAPVDVDSLILVDGGLVSNIPVNTARSMGPDFVIAVNTTSDLRSEKELEYPWNVADQTVSIPMKKLEQDELSNADYVLTPQINNWTSNTFTNIDSLILEGYLYTKKHVDKIKSQTNEILRKKSGLKETWYTNVSFEKSLPDIEDLYYKNYFNADSISNLMLYTDLCDLYSSGKYDSIAVSIISDGSSTKIKYNYKLNPVIRKVEILSNGTISDEDKAKTENILVGKPFEGKIIYDSIRNLIMKYKKQGNILFNFNSFTFDEITGELVLDFNAGIVSSITIDSKTSKTVIEREFNVKEGDPLKYPKLEEGLKNLRATGLFDDINLTVEKKGKYVDLFLSVNERVSRLLSLGFLVNNVYNFQLGIDIRDVNFLESGNELGLFLFGGTRNGAYILDYTAYRILNTYYTYKLSAYYKFNDIQVYTNTTSTSGNTYTSVYQGDYKQIFYGASLSLGTQLEKFGKLIFTGKYQADEVRNVVGDVVDPYTTNLVSLKIGAIVDNQNKYPYPEEGLYFNGFYETAQGLQSGDVGYILLNADLKYYFSLGKRSVLAPRIHVGFGDKTVPLGEQFSLGGQYSFFGAYQDQYRGRQIFLASLMYQYKLPFKIFFDTYTWFRYDIGSTWEQQEKIRFKDLRQGIGGSISFDTPIGPADFSAGRSFIVSQNLQSGSFVWGDILFYFSIGYIINY